MPRCVLNSNFISKTMIKSENLGGNSGVKKRPWAVKPFKSDIVCSAYVGSSVAGPSEKPRQEYTYFFFCIMSALPPSVCYICIKLLPGTPAWNICKQPPAEKAVPFSSETQRTLSITHSALPGLQHKSFKFVLHLIPLRMLAFRAAACRNCPRPLHI